MTERAIIIPLHQVPGVLAGGVTLLVEVLDIPELFKEEYDHYGEAELRSELCPYQPGERLYLEMPKWASRATIEIKAVRVGRLQSVTEVEAISAGVDNWSCHCGDYAKGHGACTDPPHSPVPYDAAQIFSERWSAHHPPEQAWEHNLWCTFVGIEVVLLWRLR